MLTAAVVRRPAVAGYFYPADSDQLRREVDALTAGAVSRAAVAVIAPHGSFAHAGAVAGQALGSVHIPRRCIIVGPSHTGAGSAWSLLGAGAYRTPLGDMPVDEALAEALRARCPFLSWDGSVQRGEHAVEVLVPFLQRLGPADLTLVPIVHRSERPEELAHLAQALARVVQEQEEPVLLIASSDLSQHEPRERIVAKDREVLEFVGRLDGPGLLARASEQRLSLCGAGSVAAVLDAAVRLGAKGAEVVAYGTSAAAGGDPLSSTGYAGVRIF